jgi:hypothetical protein
MIPKTRIVIASLAIFVSMLACATLLGEDPYDLDEYDTYEPAEPPAEQQSPVESVEQTFCPAITRQIAELAAYESEGDEEILDEELVLVTYTVEGDDLFDPVYETVPGEYRAGQEDAFNHQRIWEYFTALVPADQRGIIAQFSITTDGLGGTLASVAQTDFDPDSWILYVDIADTINYYEFTYTLVHEFAHMITLGPDQVTPSLAIFNNPDDEDIYFRELSACPNYFPGEGCARADSYIHLFYYEFWDELHEEWSEINLEEDDDAYYDLLDEFYEKYEDRFVNSYAATNPEEDIAEAFSFFVFSAKPRGETIAEEKMLFFYRYPEMIQLRAEILSAVCANFPK